MSELRTEHKKELESRQRQLDATKAEHETAQTLRQKKIDDLSRDMAERNAELAKTRASHQQGGKERAERDDEIARRAGRREHTPDHVDPHAADAAAQAEGAQRDNEAGHAPSAGGGGLEEHRA